jgi:hypothetical protein
MIKFIRFLAGEEASDEQVRRVIAVLTAAIAFPFLLALIIICFWLLSGLWTLSMSSPFGIWGFVGATAFSLLGSGLAGYWVTRPRTQPRIDAGHEQLAQWRKGLEDDPSTVSPNEKERWAAERALTPDALKAKLRDAMRHARENRDAASFAGVERAMDELQKADPASAELISNERWVLDKLKQGV